jgi:hypothetical protein
MNDGLEEAPTAPATKRRRGFKWLAVLALLCVVVGVWRANAALGLDPRLVGEWQSAQGTAWIFHPNGRLEILMLPGRTPVFGGQRWWQTEGDELVTGTQTAKSRANNWFQNLISPLTKFGVTGLSDSRYKIVELTDTKLQVLLDRKPPRRPVPVEVLHRAPVKGSDSQSESARAP